MEVSSSTSTLVAAASADPVSSLRAAALSTLKSKRSRKPVVEKSAPAPISRPPPPSEFQLDYGQEDTPMNIDPPSPKETAEVEVHVQEAQMREEGEISDEEDAVPTVLVKDPTPPPRRPARSPRPPRSVTPESIKTAYVNPPSPPKSFTGKQQAPPSLLDRFSDVMDYQPSEKILEPPEVAMQTDNVLELERSWQSLGPDRVRPGVLLTMDEYETVKDIVLDLLGWGVPPAFLVACGVTKEVVYYVFTELNLELPEGFDTTGMIPYTPELFAQLQESALMPPPPLPDNRRVVEDHVEETPSPTLQIEAATSSDSPSNTDLHDMERQRRQELMARKAVQASRKMKQVNSTDSNSTALTNESSGADQDDVSATSTIPSETVDDFLKSIGPVVEMDPPSAAQTPVGWPRTNGDAMDLDEVTAPLDDSQYVSIPRMRSDTLSPYSANAYEPASPSSRADTPNEPPPMSGDEPPPTSSDSMTTTYSQLSQTITPVASSSQLLPPKVNTVQRRGVKRPVASDFVDYDPAPRRNEMNGRVEQSNNPAFSNALTRRLNLTTNFQNIPSPKCVIQLSDSEGEDEEEQEQPQIQQTMEDRSWLQRDRRSKAAKYPSPVPRPSASAAEIMSPTVLEDRIRKMHEEIARKEEATRLRKLAQMAKPIPASGSSTPSVLPKQEDSDVVMSSSGTEMLERNGHAGRSSNGAYRKSESATPPPASPSRSSSHHNDYATPRQVTFPLSLIYLRCIPSSH
ncbi:hypothetical protein B0H34DRAFT_440537 [Crassisporium funariophilum]|nr:hypothetical protein B0H34DRAFT_440537 [Crassisporium funariophilum]